MSPEVEKIVNFNFSGNEYVTRTIFHCIKGKRFDRGGVSQTP